MTTTHHTPPIIQYTGQLWIIFLMLSMNLIVQAQPPDTVWTRTFGPPDRFEECMGSAPDYLGGIYVVNWSVLGMNEDFKSTVRRVDGDGNLLWQRDYVDVNVTKCGSIHGFVFVVGTFDGAGRVVCLDSSGDEIWNEYAAYDSGTIQFRSIFVDSLNNQVLVGGQTRFSEFPFTDRPALFAYSINGDSLWTQSYSDSLLRETQAIHLVNRVGQQYVLLAEANFPVSPNRTGARLLWVNEDGDLQREQNIGFQDVRVEINSVSVLSNGQFFLGGFANPGQDSEHPLVLKLGSNGELIWRRDYDLAEIYFVKVTSVAGLADGGAIIEYSVRNFPVEYDLLGIARLDSDGDTLWTKLLGFESNDIEPSEIIVNGYIPIAAGTRWIYTDTSWSKHTFVTRYDQVDDVPLIRQPNLPSVLHISTYPNPFNSTLSITLDVPLHQEISLSLFDVLGREVDVIHRGRLNNTTLNYSTPAHLSSGIYFLCAATNTKSTMQKVVLLK